MTTVAGLVERILGGDLPVAVEAYDGSRAGPPAEAAVATLVLTSPDAVRRAVSAPGELGLARAYVAGDLDVTGDLLGAIGVLRDRLPHVRFRPAELTAAARLVGVEGLRPLPPPPEEVRLRGRLHSRERDAQAIVHHYDVSNDFYRVVLGPTMTYSCAVFESPDDTLEDAQARKHDLVAQKLGLRPGMRLLDVGCGWGGMVLYAAAHYGVRAVGITLSPAQAALANERIARAGLAGSCEVRQQDYRDIDDGPFDAISSIGMFEHVGSARLREYFDRLYRLLHPGGRLLNHGIAVPPSGRTRLRPRGFMNRYVFPDGELLEVGRVVSLLQGAGFEAHHLEGLRPHYALTLRRWVANLERGWEQAVAASSPGRARAWRLYLAASALNFEAGRTQVFQVLATRTEAGRSGLPLRPDWDVRPRQLIG